MMNKVNYFHRHFRQRKILFEPVFLQIYCSTWTTCITTLPSRMKLTKRVCTLHIFFDHKAVTPLNTRKYPLDSRDWTLTATCALIFEYFMGHLAKPAFAITFGVNSAIDVVKFTFTHCDVPGTVTYWEHLWLAAALRLCLQKYTAIPIFQQTTDELSMKSCES